MNNGKRRSFQYAPTLTLSSACKREESHARLRLNGNEHRAKTLVSALKTRGFSCYQIAAGRRESRK